MHDNISSDDYLELEDIYNSIKRNFKSFLLILGLISFTSLFYAFLKPKTWEGEFQIVLKENIGLQTNTFGITEHNQS